MKKTSSVLRKVIAAALAAAIVGGGLAATGIGSVIVSNTEVSAAVPGAGSSPVVTVGDFDYSLKSDGTANVVGYHGSKAYSSSTLTMPSVIYQKDMDVEWNNWDEFKYIGSYRITSIQASIFSGCQIKLLYLPQNLAAVLGGFTGAEIGGFMIAGTNTSFSTDNVVNALYNKSGKTLYAYPSKINASYDEIVFNPGITTVSDYAFANCKYYSVEIPATVTYMGDKVFYGSNINTVTFFGNAPTFRFMPDETASDHGTFEGASQLSNITIDGANGKYNTYNGAIYSKDLSTLVLCPQGRTTSTGFVISPKCTTINDYAFYKCQKLTAIIIPDSVTYISSNSTFYGHPSGLVFYVHQDSYAQRWLSSNGYNYEILMPYTKNSDGTLTITGYNGKSPSVSIPSKISGATVSAIADSALKNNSTITSVYIPSEVKTIGERAFSGCIKLRYVGLPYSLEKIGKYAFNNTAITSITFPYNYSAVDEYAFANCYQLKDIKFNAPLKSIGTYSFEFCINLENVTIPQNVESLGLGCFYGCSKLSGVDIGGKVKSIGMYAFENTGLTSQYIPGNVTNIYSKSFGYTYDSSTQAHSRNTAFTKIIGVSGSAAETYAKNNNIAFESVYSYTLNSDGATITGFSGSDADITIPSSLGGKSVVAIGDSAFKDNANIKTVVIPSSVKTIGERAFYNCQNISSVSFSSGLTEIGEYAFGHCKSLTSVYIPGTVKKIIGGAFYGCLKLQTASFGLGLESVGEFAFANTALTYANIPKTVNTIRPHAFAYNYASEFTPVSGFKMVGYAYTAAETYAKNNTHITFEVMYEDVENKFVISASEIKPGESVELTGYGAGGKTPYTYKVSYLHDSDSIWSILEPATTSNVFTFTPDKSGSYTFRTIVTDNRGVSKEKYFYLTVKDNALKNESTVSKTKITLGEKVTVNAKASGGKSPYLYGVYIKKASSEKWTTVQSYKSNDTITVSFAAAVKYELCVKVKDSSGKIEKQYFTITVTRPLENKSVISAETIKLGEAVTVTGKANGGTSPYLYGVYYKKATSEKWSTAQSYNKNAVVKVTPKAAVKYEVCVKVKDSAGKIEKKYFNLTVTK